MKFASVFGATLGAVLLTAAQGLSLNSVNATATQERAGNTSKKIELELPSPDGFRNSKEATLHNAFAAVLGDRSVVTWGDAGYGGDRSTVQEQLRDVQQIQASPRSFAATLGDAWGNSDRGDDSSAVQQQLKNLQQIPAFDRVLAAITGDGSVVTWGDAGYGGNSSAVQGQLRDVQQIQASPRAFAAILGDGFVAIPTMVGTGTVQQIQASHRAFLAILGVGSVVTWNNSDRGADSGVVQKQLPSFASTATLRVIMSISVDVHLLSGKRASVEVDADASVESLKRRAQSALVVPSGGRLLNSSGEVLDSALTITEAKLVSGDVLTLHVNQVQLKPTMRDGDHAFATLLGDGSVETFGDDYHGGDSSAVQEQLRDVQQIQASECAFAAIRSDGSVVSWGPADYGGESSAVQEQLRDVQQIQASSRAFAAIRSDGTVVTWGKATLSSAVRDQLRDVQQIQASRRAFAAIRSDGSVVTWGPAGDGGDSSAVQEQLRDAQQIQSSKGAFAAIRSDGSVVTWGPADFGGDSSAVQEQLRDVQQIQASAYAFAAIRCDGSVVTWGPADCGGDSSAVQEQLRDVQQIQASGYAFAAIRSDGSVVTWGLAGDGGDSSAVQEQLRDVQQIQVPPEQQAQVKSFVLSLREVLPCHTCAHHWRQQLEEDPIEPHLSNRTALVDWMIGMHNQVNKRNGHRIFTREEALVEFQLAYDKFGRWGGFQSVIGEEEPRKSSAGAMSFGSALLAVLLAASW
ncbi:hypothetical protein AK812_SmicGene20996 [Symbiodinium microadriaticum]|uniref:thiol oxidase n=1 Tax=Symbiodinium microadriaticum TaxID=2951 RepID=A0A1Q9DNG6_SYMMI|nr:hypothetical protein AK812_SmicGene20996 [Symbiodinium microadriaticum]